MLLKIHPDNPGERHMKIITECLQDGGVIIYPTDTVFGLGCDITKIRALDRVAQIKGVKREKANFSIICSSLSHLSDYARQIPNPVYKLMKRTLPGPYTFILNASNNVPHFFQTRKKTVGIRVPDNNIIREIIRELGNPILSTSIHDEDEILEYSTDPELIHEKYQDIAEIVIDGGYGEFIPSTIVDCTGDEPVIIRQGLGVLET